MNEESSENCGRLWVVIYLFIIIALLVVLLILSNLYNNCNIERDERLEEEEFLIGSKHPQRKKGKENWFRRMVLHKLLWKRNKRHKSVEEHLRRQSNLLLWTVNSEDVEERRRRLFGQSSDRPEPV